MSGFDDGLEASGLVRYRGTPREPDRRGEKGRMQRFLESTIPFLKQKLELADRTVESLARQEMAKADQMEADAEVAKWKARQEQIRTAEMAREFERDRTTGLDLSAPVPPDKVLEALEALQEKIDTFSMLYGMRVEVSADGMTETVPSGSPVRVARGMEDGGRRE